MRAFLIRLWRNLVAAYGPSDRAERAYRELHGAPPDLDRCAVVAEGGHRPCDCGAVFDDVNTTVIYPHARF